MAQAFEICDRERRKPGREGFFFHNAGGEGECGKYLNYTGEKQIEVGES